MWLRPTALGGAASYVVVQGHSMEPTYEDGDLVLVREAGTLREGDIIAFRAGGSFDDPTRIIHRIVGDAGDGTFNTQGDNRDRDRPLDPGPDDIIGKALSTSPWPARPPAFLTQPADVRSPRRRGGRRGRRTTSAATTSPATTPPGGGADEAPEARAHTAWPRRGHRRRPVARSAA